MFENVDGRTDGRTPDAGVTGILIAHLGAFDSGELKIQNNSNEIEIISQNVPNNALYQSEEECKDQESIQSSTIPDSGHRMGK